MFIGADVSHAAPGSKAPSLATMVGSVDHEGVHYACPLPLNQNNREESISGVRSMVTELVNIYKKNTNTYPVRVMYFRDGVAEGQFAKVKDLEVTAIKEAIAAVSGSAPTVTAIVVRKRNHTRFFPKENEGDRGSRGNVHPGTVVDQEITHPRDFDFCTFALCISSKDRFGAPFKYPRDCSSGTLLYTPAIILC
jgi:eukaryotic translation initiation factor 2C